MRIPTTTPRPLRVGELAEHLGVCTRTIRRRIAAGEIASFRLGGGVFIPRRELERLSGIEPESGAA